MSGEGRGTTTTNSTVCAKLQSYTSTTIFLENQRGHRNNFTYSIPYNCVLLSRNSHPHMLRPRKLFHAIYESGSYPRTCEEKAPRAHLACSFAFSERKKKKLNEPEERFQGRHYTDGIPNLVNCADAPTDGRGGKGKEKIERSTRSMCLRFDCLHATIWLMMGS